MKKFTLALLAFATAFGASAQMAVLKEAKKAAAAETVDAAKVVSIITPALSDPETSVLAETWFVPGDASFKNYDYLLGLKQLGRVDEGTDLKMAKLLVDGYEYFKHAFALDTIVDPKGKIKTKYSKKMCGTLSGHFSDYTTAGVEFYNDKDYENAYKAWDIFCALPKIPDVAKSLNNQKTMPADTIFGEIAFNQALAAWQVENYDNALKAFENSKNYGYNKKQLYDYAIAVAQGKGDNEAILAWSEAALPVYGQEDPMYMSQIVNYYLQNKQLDKAFERINEAIALDPNNSQFYFVKGVLYENDGKKAEAKAQYEKAVELNPENAQAVYYLGRQICEEAYALSDEAPTNQAEYNEYFTTKLKPLFEKAAEVLERAYTLNPEDTDILKYLENVYYNLNDEKMLQDVKARM